MYQTIRLEVILNNGKRNHFLVSKNDKELTSFLNRVNHSINKNVVYIYITEDYLPMWMNYQLLKMERNRSQLGG